MSLSYKVENRGKIAVIALSGRMIADETEELLKQLSRTIADGAVYLIFDMKELSYCNSSGLNFFIRSLTRTRNAGGDVILAGVQPSVGKLLELAKLDQIFTIASSVEEAAERLTIA